MFDEEADDTPRGDLSGLIDLLRRHSKTGYSLELRGTFREHISVTALTLAVSSGWCAHAKVLIEKGAAIDPHDQNILWCDPGCLRLLIDNGADVENALLKAIQDGNLERAQLLFPYWSEQAARDNLP